MDTDGIYLKVRKKNRVIRLAGRDMVEIGNLYLYCFVTATAKRPEGPPYFIDLTIKNLDTNYLATHIGGGNRLNFSTQPNRRFQVELGHNRRFKKIEGFCIDWRFAVNILVLLFLSQNKVEGYG
jgi:hypothetical protein